MKIKHNHLRRVIREEIHKNHQMTLREQEERTAYDIAGGRETRRYRRGKRQATRAEEQAKVEQEAAAELERQREAEEAAAADIQFMPETGIFTGDDENLQDIQAAIMEDDREEFVRLWNEHGTKPEYSRFMHRFMQQAAAKNWPTGEAVVGEWMAKTRATTGEPYWARDNSEFQSGYEIALEQPPGAPDGEWDTSARQYTGPDSGEEAATAELGAFSDGSNYTYDFTAKAKAKTEELGKLHATVVTKHGAAYGPATFEVPEDKALHTVMMADGEVAAALGQAAEGEEEEPEAAAEEPSVTALEIRGDSIDNDLLRLSIQRRNKDISKDKLEYLVPYYWDNMLDIARGSMRTRPDEVKYDNDILNTAVYLTAMGGQIDPDNLPVGMSDWRDVVRTANDRYDWRSDTVAALDQSEAESETAVAATALPESFSRRDLRKMILGEIMRGN